MTDSPPSKDLYKFFLRMPDDLRARLAAAADRNGRSLTAEALKAIEAHVDMMEFARRAGEEIANDLPAPTGRIDRLHIDFEADGTFSMEEVLAQMDGIQALGDFKPTDWRVTVITPEMAARDERKAQAAEAARKYGEVLRLKRNKKSPKRGA